MIGIQQTRRLLHINRVFMRYGLDEVLVALGLHKARWIGRLQPHHRLARGSILQRPRGERIRMALEELGPVFVKLGQALSTRRDLLPDDIAEELIKLQDKVPPFAGDIAQQQVEQALGQPVAELFANFEVTPLASASVAQVHRATLHSGENVVVKVLRPGIEDVIRRDVAVLYELARIAAKYSDDASRLRPLEVVAEYERTILDELDLMREAANGSTLRRNFENSPLLYVPAVYWDYCRSNVLVLEEISGIPIGDIEALKAAGTNFKVLAERGVEIFFTQTFRDNFFHADMHPGNIFVDVRDPENPQYIAVDFGIIGSLTDADQRYIAWNLLAFFNRDYRRVAELHIESGWVPADTRVDDFEAAARAVCEPFFDKPLGEISFGLVLLRLFSIGRRFRMEVQPQLVLLQKTLLNIEGLGRQLYPDLNLWDTAKPYLERWAKERFSPQALWEKWQSKLPELPDKLWKLSQALEQFDPAASQAQQLQAQEQLRQQQAKAARQQRWTLIGSSALLLGGLLQFSYGVSPYAPQIGVGLAGFAILCWYRGSK
jgi:ubiquinone biosynthesis protein